MNHEQKMARYFWRIITQACDYPCPKTQRAIDRLSFGLVDGRASLIHNLRETFAGDCCAGWFINWIQSGANYRAEGFNPSLRSDDLKTITGRDRDYWFSELWRPVREKAASWRGNE